MQKWIDLDDSEYLGFATMAIWQEFPSFLLHFYAFLSSGSMFPLYFPHITPDVKVIDNSFYKKMTFEDTLNPLCFAVQFILDNFLK